MERKFFFFLLLIFITLLPGPLVADEIDSAKIAQINNQGRQFAIAGDLDAAEKTFISILSLDPNSVRALNNLGVIYKMLGRYNDALRVYSEAEDIVRKNCGQSCPDLAAIYINIGIVLKLMQDYELALQYLKSAENIILSSNNVQIDASAIYNNLGNVYFGMHEWKEALNSYKKGIAISKMQDPEGLDISYANCASVYEKMELLDSALLFYELSIQSKIDQYGGQSFRLISTYNNYSFILLKLHELQRSKEYLLKSIKLVEANYPEKHPLISETYKYMGLWYLENKNFEMALEYFQKAINAVVFDYYEEDYLKNPSLDGDIISEPTLLDALKEKAKVLALIFKEDKNVMHLDASLQTLELANLLTEKMRSEYLGQESKLLLTENARSGYENSIITAFQLYELTEEKQYAEKAFIYAEKSKSSVLLASLQEVENKKNLGIPQEIQDFEDGLKVENDFYKKKLYEERQRINPDSAKLVLWQAKLLSLSQQLDSIGNFIDASYPQYAAKYKNEVVGLNEVMNGLQDNQALIEYAITDSLLFIFVIENEDYIVKRVEIDSVFHKQTNILGEFLRNNDFANNTFEDYQAYTEAAYGLYQFLIEPVEQQLEGKNLIVIPDGELGYIPFEALLSEPPLGDVMDYRNLAYLIYKYRINYSYSATLFLNNKQEAKSSNGRLIAFAPSYENINEISSDKFPAYRNYSTYLVPLKYISQEINNISAIVDCDMYKNNDATEKAFKTLAPDYDILHLAMHTLINDDNPMYSQLVFTLNNDTIESNDGLLNVYEIFNMKLNARMAVLSACNTGSGQLRKGEGVMSLARGFIFAGVPSIIMTLWAVEDQSGSVLMSAFYENLNKGLDIDEALRDAKLQYLKNADQLNAHPYLWSGYVSIGATDSLMSSSIFGNIFYIITGIAGLIIIILIFLIRFKKKRT